jgi:flagellar M-ring protein FliF
VCLNRLSVAVIINSDFRGKVENEDELSATSGKVTDEELEKFKKLVQQAVGYQKDRGDSIEVLSQPFQQANIDMVDVLREKEQKDFINMAVQYGLILLIAAFVFFIAYKLMSYLTGGADTVEVLQDGQLPPGEDQLALPGAELLDELDEDEGPLLEKIRDYVKRNPDKAAAVVRFWLNPSDED